MLRTVSGLAPGMRSRGEPTSAPAPAPGFWSAPAPAPAPAPTLYVLDRHDNFRFLLYIFFSKLKLIIFLTFTNIFLKELFSINC